MFLFLLSTCQNGISDVIQANCIKKRIGWETETQNLCQCLAGDLRQVVYKSGALASISISWKRGIHIQLWQLLILYHFLGNHWSVPGEDPLAASAWLIPLLCTWCCWWPCCAPHGAEPLLLFFHWLSSELQLWWPIKPCLWYSIAFLAQDQLLL